MVDRVSRETRSKIMASIKGVGTKLELKAKAELEPLGFEFQPKDIFGRPDFAHRAKMVAVFVDSCFFHRCPDHCKMPESNAEFWRKKLEANVRRAEAVTGMLEDGGWTVVRVWEHDIDREGCKKVRMLVE